MTLPDVHIDDMSYETQRLIDEIETNANLLEHVYACIKQANRLEMAAVNISDFVDDCIPIPKGSRFSDLFDEIIEEFIVKVNWDHVAIYFAKKLKK